MAEYSVRIFVARRRGRAAGMLAAFQGSAASTGGKNTDEELPIFTLVSIINPLDIPDRESKLDKLSSDERSIVEIPTDVAD